MRPPFNRSPGSSAFPLSSFLFAMQTLQCKLCNANCAMQPQPSTLNPNLNLYNAILIIIATGKQTPSALGWPPKVQRRPSASSSLWRRRRASCRWAGHKPTFSPSHSLSLSYSLRHSSSPSPKHSPKHSLRRPQTPATRPAPFSTVWAVCLAPAWSLRAPLSTQSSQRLSPAASPQTETETETQMEMET